MAASDKARALSLAGWIRNRADGDVELMAQGEKASLEQLREWLHQGPTAARVRSVVEQTTDARDLPRPFAVV